MKIAKVVPVFKKGDKDDVNNYRPISLLTSVSKILEKIVYIRTCRFCQFHHIFTDFQFGFRENHSTSHALLSFVEKATQALDKFCHMVGIFLDFSKAFDTINHEILLKGEVQSRITIISKESIKISLQIGAKMMKIG